MTPIPRTERLLRRLRHRQKAVWAAAVIAAALAVLGLLGLFAAVTEALFWLAPGVRLPFSAGVAGFMGAVVLLAVVLLAIVLRPGRPGNRTLARHIAERDPELRDRPLLAVDLARGVRGEASGELRERALAELDEAAAGRDPRRYLRRRALVLALRGLGVVGLLALASLLLAGGSLRSATHRLMHPARLFERPGQPRLTMAIPDTVRAVEGDTLQLAVRARNVAVHTPPRFVLEDGSGQRRTLDAAADSADTALFTARWEDVRRGARVHARLRNRNSDTVSVLVTPRPRIARMEVSLQPPGYTGLEPTTLPEGVGDLTALPGTRVEIRLEASRPLERAQLIMDPHEGRRDTTRLAVRQRTASGGFTLGTPGRWWVELLARDGVAGEDPIRWSARLLEDLPPTLTVHRPEDSALIPDNLAVPLVAEAEDDFGVRRMRLRYRVFSPMMSADSVGEEAFAALELPLDTLDRRRAQVRRLWGLADLPLLPTDEVRFFLEAWDNDAVRGPKRARSAERRLVFPSAEELYARQERQERSAMQELEGTMERAEQLKQKLEENLRQLRSDPESMSWEQAQALQRSVEQQRETLQRMEEVGRTLEQMREQAASQGLLSESLREKYRRVQELMQEIATPELREAMENLQQALEELDPQRVREALERMARRQDELEANLDRSLAILEQLRRERMLDELASRAEAMAERERELAARADTASLRDRARLEREQELIRRELNTLARQTRQSADSLDEEAALADSLRRVGDALSEGEIPETVAEALDALQRGAMSRAGRRASEAAEKMEQSARSLRGLHREMVAQGKREVSRSLERLADAILAISRRQEELRSRSAELSVASPSYRSLAADQGAIAEATHLLEAAARALSNQTFLVGGGVAGNLQRSRVHMEEAIGRYTDRRPSQVSSEQGRAMALMHHALLSLFQAKREMDQASSGTGYEEMMERLRQMARQQQQLNQGSQNLPMPMPGGRDMMAEMAARQRALAQKMQRLEQEAGRMDEILGSLEGMSEAMEEVAKDLEQHNVSERTRRLQQRIVQRLLDSQRSLQQRDRSRERRGRVAEDILRESPGPLPGEEASWLRERMRRALEGDYARPWREVIRDYYRALERDEAAADTTRR